MSKASFFAIASTGQTATRWLSNSLNSHPDIWCLHGRTEPDQSVNKGVLENSPQILLEQMRNIKERKFYGSVHRHSVQTIAPYQNHPDLAVVLNIIRHPIMRIQSTYGAYLKTEKEEWLQKPRIKTLKDYWDICENWARYYNLDLSSYEVRAFLCAALQMPVFVSQLIGNGHEIERDKENNILMERMTTDPAYFVWIFSKITSIELDVNDGYIKTVFSENNTPKHNSSLSHNPKTMGRSAEQVIAAWLPWQRAITKDILLAFKAETYFGCFGYDMHIDQLK